MTKEYTLSGINCWSDHYVSYAIRFINFHEKKKKNIRLLRPENLNLVVLVLQYQCSLLTFVFLFTLFRYEETSFLLKLHLIRQFTCESKSFFDMFINRTQWTEQTDINGFSIQLVKRLNEINTPIGGVILSRTFIKKTHTSSRSI